MTAFLLALLLVRSPVSNALSVDHDRSFDLVTVTITTYDLDALGRVIKTNYEDGTTEETRFEPVTGRVSATRDRAKQWLVYAYDAPGGRVSDVLLSGVGDNGPQFTGTGFSGTPFIHYEYDLAGRLTAVRNADAACEYDQYDMLGRPQITRSVRYASHSGLAQQKTILDIHTQGHVWSVFDGERTRWRMPAAGGTLPQNETKTTWRNWIDETRDGAGNLVAQHAVTTIDEALNAQTSFAQPLVSDAQARGAGRLIIRTRYGLGGATVASGYGYADGSSSQQPVRAPGPASGMFGRMDTAVFGTTVIGSEITRTPAKRIAGETDLGLGARLSTFRYDDRQRLTFGALGRHSDLQLPATPSETVTPAGFRGMRVIAPPMLDSSQLGLLGDTAKTIVPFDWTVTQAVTKVHQLDARTLTLGGAQQGDLVKYTFDGGRRMKSGDWTQTYDELGRLVSMQSSDRQITFTYDPNDRIVGRKALKGDGTPEDRLDVIQNDGLPADTTFVWDPLTDRLLAIYETGASVVTSGTVGTNAGLVQQYLHGDQGMDDPIDVLVANKTTPNTADVFLPVFDEAGTGALQAVMGADGSFVERVLYADAYGDAPRYLQGAVADRMEISATKDANGTVTQVVVKAHLSEKLDPATLTAGVRLAAVKADHSTAAVSQVDPVATDANTITWTLDGGDWEELETAAGADSLEVALGSSLRFAGWGATPLQPPPGWTMSLYSVATSGTYPLMVRQRFTNLDDSWADSAAGATSTPVTLYDIPALYLAANVQSKSKLVTGWKAAPFIEPATGFAFFRARWYDAGTGTWLTPDPLGYQDSSNPYAFAGGDPVNGSDPTGNDTLGFAGSVRRGGAWLKSKVFDLSTPESGIGVVDAGNRLSDLYAQTTTASAIDVGTSFTAGLFELGAKCGTSLGNADWENHPIRSSVGVQVQCGLDELDALLYGTAIYGVAEAPVKSALKSISFDDLGDALVKGLSEGLADATEELAPRITQGSIERQRVLSNLDASRTARSSGRFAEYVQREAAADTTSLVRRVRNVAQRGFDYAVENPRVQGLNRMQLGKDAEVQATRWLRRWAERNEIEGVESQVRGANSVPDVAIRRAQQIFDFKLTPKAVRRAQGRNFQADFVGYATDYIFGPGAWRVR